MPLLGEHRIRGDLGGFYAAFGENCAAILEEMNLGLMS